jgi:hypothetical protein
VAALRKQQSDREGREIDERIPFLLGTVIDFPLAAK